jgi:hypothetical protein
VPMVFDHRVKFKTSSDLIVAILHNVPNTDSITPQNSRTSTYIRPVGPELVCSKHPSCSNLPPAWNSIHDRFIAYLATHAPLDKNGKIPRHEEKRERWKSEDIARLVMERFPEIGTYYVSVFLILRMLAFGDLTEVYDEK